MPLTSTRLHIQEHSAEVGDSISEVVRRLGVTRSQKSEGEAYRGAQPCSVDPSAVTLQRVLHGSCTTACDQALKTAHYPARSGQAGGDAGGAG